MDCQREVSDFGLSIKWRWIVVFANLEQVNFKILIGNVVQIRFYQIYVNACAEKCSHLGNLVNQQFMRVPETKSFMIPEDMFVFGGYRDLCHQYLDDEDIE